MANKHLQQHNVWPIGWATILWVVSMIFIGGGLHARFSILESNLDKYVEKNDKRIESLHQAIYDLRLADNEPLTVIDNNNRVLGIATTSATLKLSVTPTKRPVTPTQTPTPTTTPIP